MTGSYQERAEDILTVANDGRASDQQFKDRSEWERSVIRSYTNNVITNYRQYEATHKMPDPRTIVIDATGKVTQPAKQLDLDLKMDGTSTVPVNAKQSKGRTFKCANPLGDKQVEWLKRGIVFYRQYERALDAVPNSRPMDASFETRAGSVGELIQMILDDAAWRMIAQADIKELETESKQPEPK